MDLPFLVLVLTLVAFGLVMLCSASSAVALYRRQDAFAYVRPQLLYAAMGLVAMLSLIHIYCGCGSQRAERAGGVCQKIHEHQSGLRQLQDPDPVLHP